VQAGAGAGPQLTYVPGRVYLAGPIAGAPLSAVAIVPAVAGPFDVGTVVYRQALRVDPRSARVSADGAASDPLPHILAGIPLAVRDIQVAIDRPDFTLNPTLRAHVRPRPGDANFSRAVVTLPRSAFLEQAHIRTICTRVQFAAGPGNGALCPKGARYGYARAWSPLIDGPAQGPVYLRSSTNKLPDLVAALKGPVSAPIDFELSARIDSIRGGIRSTFTAIPDLPVSRFILGMQGGRKGLIVNSRNLCNKPARNRAKANLRGQNGKLARSRPRVVATKCAKRRKARRAHRAHRARRDTRRP